jgi:hypothetical protein
VSIQSTPAKIVCHVTESIDNSVQFGKNSNVNEADAHVRSVMPTAHDGLGHEQRYPELG